MLIEASPLWEIWKNVFRILAVFVTFIPQYDFNYPHWGSLGIFILSFLCFEPTDMWNFNNFFHNLPKFFHEHARGTRTIFHLCKIILFVLKCCGCYYNQVTNRSAKVSNIGLPQTGNVLHFLNLFPLEQDGALSRN